MAKSEYEQSSYKAPPYDTRKRRKPRKPVDEELPKSLSACKKQLRSITRLLGKDKGLPSTKRIELERRAKALTLLQGQLTNSKVDKANATRYHGVKFIERKKVLRKLAQEEKKHADLQDLLVNLNYTTYYPDEIKYISLYPVDPLKTPADVVEKREAIRLAIKDAMERNDLPKDPREVSTEDRMAIRRNNRTLLRTVSKAHGQEIDESASESDNENEASAPNLNEIKNDEDDEFFA